MPNFLKYVIALAVCMLFAGCQKPAATPDSEWAVNIGGDRYVGVDGTEYMPDSSISGGVIGTLDAVKGSQDELLYATYREGDMEISRPMANGVYDITLHFAEPDDVPGGTRVFDTIVEGATVIDDLDVMVSRDGKVRSALTVTVAGVRIDDGELNIEFKATAEEPILSAVVVRPKTSPDSAWRLTHSDEFDYEGAPRSSMWNADLWPARVVNDEDQAYTNNPRNLRVEDGHLIIEAHQEALDNAQYTSARIHTSGKVDFLYGRIEVRAKLPQGMGTWPAIWMLPSAPFRYATRCAEGDTWQGSADCDAWPNSGEIDIMEHVGYEMGHVHGTVHNEAYYWAKWEQRKGRIIVDDVDQAFHVYAMEWTPERIDVFLDDTLYFTYVNENDGWRSWPYDHPFHLILNVAVGGMWGRAGGGIDDTIFPQKMLVDYVRFFERSNPPDDDDR
jgi:beta-glucanase (GH16 family)